MEVRGITPNKVPEGTAEAPKIGSMLRVKVLKRLDPRHLLVHFNGKNHHARIAGLLPSDLFIAQVQKIKPHLQLKFLRDLAKKHQPMNRENITRILDGKKQLIQKMFNTDNFDEALSVHVKEDRRETGAAFRRSISNRHVLASLNGTKEVREYLLLESLQNFISSDSFYFLLPLIVGQRRHMAEMKLIGNRENDSHGVFLTIEVDSETTIVCAVFLDYETIQCTLSTNSPEIEGVLKEKMHLLVSGFKSLQYNRKVHIRLLPYGQCEQILPATLKQIDVKM
jgi:hypothetical protein